MSNEQLNLNFTDWSRRERVICVAYIDEAGISQCKNLVPFNISFGRGAWWLEANLDTGEYVRLRLTSINAFFKVLT